MLVCSKAYAESASAVPNIIAGVVIHPVGYGERDPVEEHIAAQAIVCLA